MSRELSALDRARLSWLAKETAAPSPIGLGSPRGLKNVVVDPMLELWIEFPIHVDRKIHRSGFSARRLCVNARGRCAFNGQAEDAWNLRNERFALRNQPLIRGVVRQLPLGHPPVVDGGDQQR